MMEILRKIGWGKGGPAGSSRNLVATQGIISRCITDPDFPYLISFPRTGSHWLRMIMELYFDRPLLVRSFYEHSNSNYMLYHTHDMNFTDKRKSVIYLYRNPVDTVYSQILYYKHDFRNKLLVTFWMNYYFTHVLHWLKEDKHTVQKTILTYENLKQDMGNEFGKVCAHFNAAFDSDRIIQCSNKITKAEVKKNSTYIASVMTISEEYEQNRTWFRNNYGTYIYESWNQTLALHGLLNDSFFINLFGK